MAGDLATMVSRIAAEMRRPDLALTAATAGNPNGNAIRLAIATAISEYQKQRFRFSDIDPSIPTTFLTVPSQSVYTSADNPIIGSMYLIDYINIQLGNTLQEMRRVTPEQQHLNIQLFNQNGFPTSYAYEGNALIFYPVPDATIYTVYIGAHRNIAAPATDNEADNPWMTDAELLIRCRAKYELYTHVLRNDKMAAVMSPLEDGSPNGNQGETYKAWKSLKAEGNKITGRGKVRPMAW